MTQIWRTSLSSVSALMVHAHFPGIAERHTMITLAHQGSPQLSIVHLCELNSAAGPAPQVHSVEEQVTRPTVAANPTTSVLRVINVNKNAAYPKTIEDLKASGALPESVELRQVKYLNTLIE